MKKLLRAIAALMLTMLVVCAACTKDPNNDDPNNPNGGNNGGSGGGNGSGGNGSGTELPTGMYLGVIGFNDELFTKPITRLNDQSIRETQTFIENLQMDDATLLIESVNTSLDLLSSSGIPKELINVSIVNFTDGMDEGSWNYSNHHHGTYYSNGTEYLQAVTQRIQNERIGGKPIKAHTIAFKGDDVYNETLFSNTLKGITSSPENKYLHVVSDMSQVQGHFREIADSLHQTSINSILTIRFPVPNEIPARIRFTFDPINDVSQSHQYIEGVFIMGSDGKGVLTNVQYEGLSSSSGNTVTASSTGDVKVEFKFERMKDSNDNNFTNSSIENVKKWMRIDNDTWVPNSEWDSSGNTEVNNEYYSCLIILNLDCSKSLGDQAFRALQNAAKDFVDILKTE